MNIPMCFTIDNMPTRLLNLIVEENKIYGHRYYDNKKILIVEYETEEQTQIELERFKKKFDIHLCYKFPTVKQHKRYVELSKKMKSNG